MSGDAHPADAAPRRRSWLAALPVLIFAGLAGIFLYQLVSGHDPQEIPSALIGAKAPATSLPPLDGLVSATGAPVPGLDLAQGDGRPTLVNVFASWCGPCRLEHPFLLGIARDPRVRLVGINYKDKPENARRFLGDLGNPYAAVGTDVSGRAGIDWGVYGVPETFLVAADGTILWKQTGPFSEKDVAEKLEPAIARAVAGGG
ncbi:MULTISPECIES: DsbE family thiol:disulfide interchange protein [unclassified Aureimonas]|uniref:DsbE family thiol:disulfide interchange protein n=1 Tax=unclassified Aureimonas TaxID=2615206 RepID=UPI0006F2EAF9|nr:MULTISPECIES: DsbE family thiol:disulfide interchange protein [unclassified Aureimonas]KQT65916.1 thiol:disulfide interchange protein [Aureimonas sp. Leaf427]KQT73275.1 thiol:disulfide interchange protein [Aureimonas sp. Leaf460]